MDIGTIAIILLLLLLIAKVGTLLYLTLTKLNKIDPKWLPGQKGYAIYNDELRLGSVEKVIVEITGKDGVIEKVILNCSGIKRTFLADKVYKTKSGVLSNVSV
ncbi:MAG: hypothetical protein GY861_22460 [bacterium]|nr:hypothetical protein [bacterium]